MRETDTQMRPLAAIPSPAPLPRPPSVPVSLSAILMLNSYSAAGRCTNHHRAQHSSMPGRKWPGQLLAIQPETCDLHYGKSAFFFCTVTFIFIFSVRETLL